MEQVRHMNLLMKIILTYINLPRPLPVCHPTEQY